MRDVGFRGAQTARESAVDLARAILPRRLKRLARRFLAPRADERPGGYRMRRIDEATVVAVDHHGFVSPTRPTSAGIRSFVRAFDVESHMRAAEVADLLSFLEVELPGRIRADASFLDYGCAYGRYGRLLKRRGSSLLGVRYVGADRSPDALRIAKALNPASEFLLLETGTGLPLGNSSVDVVLASAVLMMYREASPVVRELCRVASECVVVARHPLSAAGPKMRVLQTFQTRVGEEQHTFWLESVAEFESTVKSLGIRILAKRRGVEEFAIDGLSEPAHAYHYLLDPSGLT